MVPALRHAISYHRNRTWWYERRAGVSPTPTVHQERRTHSVAFLRWINNFWQRRLRAAHRLHPRPVIAHLALWLCIHRGEGAWNANTGNGYYGGLQMTSGWGGVERPDKLSPSAQMALAEREYRASGYSTGWLEGQWPNTSPPCLGHA